MGFKWLDCRIYGQEQIIIKEAAIEVAMQKAGNPWFLLVSIGFYWFLLVCWICMTLFDLLLQNAILHQVEEIIKGAKGQAARVQIQNEATLFLMLSMSWYGFVWKCWVNIPNEIAIQ